MRYIVHGQCSNRYRHSDQIRTATLACAAKWRVMKLNR